MTTLSQFIGSVKKQVPNTEVIFRYPTLFLVCQDEEFASIPESEREAFFIRQSLISHEEVVAATQAGAIQMIFCTPGERVELYQFLDAPGAIPH